MIRRSSDLLHEFVSLASVAWRWLLVGMLCTVWGTSQVHAETVSYGSVPLQVDELTSIGSEQLKISLGGESFITSRKDAGRKVANIYLSKARVSQQLVRAQVAELILEATRLEDQDVAAAAFGLAMYSGLFSEQEFRALIAKLRPLPLGPQVLEQGIVRGGDQARGRLFCIALQYLEASRLKSLKDVSPLRIYRHQFECTEYLRGRAQSLLEGGDIEGAQQILETAIAAFNDGSQLFLEIITVQQKLEKLRMALKDGDVSNTAALLEAVFEVPLMRPSKERIYPLIVDALIDTLLARGEIEGALEALPLIDFGRRTDREDDQVVKVLKEIHAKDCRGLRSADVRDVLRVFSEKSDFVRDEYLAALSRTLNELVLEGDEQLPSQVFEQLMEVRPDPSADNDAIRIHWVRVLLSRGKVSEASEILETVRTGVPLALRMRMAMATFNWLGGGLVVVCGVMLLGILRRTRSRVGGQAEPSQSSGGEGRHQKRGSPAKEDREEEEPQPRPFVAFMGGGRPERGADEYDRCLETFGLKSGVNLAGIKVAYRNAVKSCHPDLNPNSTEADTERFIELTKAYDRLVKLHADRTGER